MLLPFSLRCWSIFCFDRKTTSSYSLRVCSKMLNISSAAAVRRSVTKALISSVLNISADDRRRGVYTLTCRNGTICWVARYREIGPFLTSSLVGIHKPKLCVFGTVESCVNVVKSESFSVPAKVTRAVFSLCVLKVIFIVN